MSTTITTIDTLKLKELQNLYYETFGKTTASRNRPWLVKKLQSALADKTTNDQTEPKAKATKKKKAKPAAKPKEEPAEPACLSKAVASLGLEVGTTIEKTYKGEVITLTIREHGFEVGGTLYKSLSAAAKSIAGCNWNGHVFFGLKKRSGTAS